MNAERFEHAARSGLAASLRDEAVDARASVTQTKRSKHHRTRPQLAPQPLVVPNTKFSLSQSLRDLRARTSAFAASLVELPGTFEAGRTLLLKTDLTFFHVIIFCILFA